MIDQCFVTVSPALMLAIAIAITVFSIWRVFYTFRGEKTAFILVMAFLVMTALGIIFIPCWAFVVAIIGVGVAEYLAKVKMHELIVK
jgi:hypothetical protein